MNPCCPKGFYVAGGVRWLKRHPLTPHPSPLLSPRLFGQGVQKGWINSKVNRRFCCEHRAELCAPLRRTWQAMKDDGLPH
jgi:hypothetical protein